MKFSLSWLEKYLDFGQQDRTVIVEKLKQTLNDIGLELESCIDKGQTLAPFHVVEITKLSPHPDADKLQICEIKTKDGLKHVVCGDPTIEQGMKTVLACPGDYVPGLDTVLSKAKIRGIESDGMLCSDQELGLAATSDGIVRVSADIPVGANYANAMGVDEVLFDIAITPNRGDCANIIGIACDLAAAGCGKFKPVTKPTIATADINKAISVRIDDKAAADCPIFMGRVIKGVKNGPSPSWLQRKMNDCGLKSISKLVDVTNYISHELGRPLHVFDLNKLVDDEILITKAVVGQKITALDECEYTLDENTTIIANNGEAISIAGIMGGQNSGSYDDTVDVFVESAFFQANDITRSGQKLNIISDARYRFERAADPAIVELGLDMAVAMILELCGGQAGDIIGAISDDVTGNDKYNTRIIEFTPALVAKSLGVTIAEDKPFSLKAMTTVLCKLGFNIINSDSYHGQSVIKQVTQYRKLHDTAQTHMDDVGQNYKIAVASWRNDVTCAHDLVEEMARIIGYSNIEPHGFDNSCYPLAQNKNYSSQLMNSGHRAGQLLASRAMHEVMTWAFHCEKMADLFYHQPAIKVSNPISQDLSIMRMSLIPGMLMANQRNNARGQTGNSFFEIGRVYQCDNDGVVHEYTHGAGIRSDKSPNMKHWLTKQRNVDAFDAKDDVIALLNEFGLESGKYQIINGETFNERFAKTGVTLPGYYHPYKIGVVMQGPKKIIGYFGMLHPAVLQELAIDHDIACFEINLNEIANKTKQAKDTQPDLNPYQMVMRDFAFLIDREIPANELIKTVNNVDKKLLRGVRIFDVYTGDKIDATKKSIAINVAMQATDGTLNDDQIQLISKQIIDVVVAKFNGQLRSAG